MVLCGIDSQCRPAIITYTEFSFTPNLEYFTHFLTLTPIFGKVSIEEYSKTPTLS